MPAPPRYPLVLLAIASLVLLLNLGGGTLFDEDEPKNAECAREMLARGDWIVPTFNDELRTDKPILLYWLMMGAYSVLGVGELGARLWSALFGVGTVMLTYQIGRRLFDRDTGLWAGLALATSMMFDVVARHATPDSTLIFFITLGFALYVRAVARQTDGAWQTAAEGDDQQRLAHYTPGSLTEWIGIYSALALAVLAKGPVGIVLPVGILGLFLLCLTRPPVATPWPDKWPPRLKWLVLEAVRPLAPARIWRAGLAMRPWIGLAVLAVVAVPWYVAVGLATDGAWIAGFLGKHNVGRFVATMENHRGPIVYYVVAILVGFFPWSVFLTPSLTIFVRRWRSTPVGRPALLLLACWAGLWIAFFSLAGTKLPNYVLPAYPALALIVGYFLAAWIRSPQMVTSRLVLPSLVTLAVVGAGLIVGLGVVAMLLLPGDWPIAAVGLAPLVGGVLATLAYRRGKVRRAVVAFGVSAMLLSTLAFAWVAPRVSRHQNASPLVAAAHAAQGPDTRLATYDLWLPSVVFYAQAPVARLADANHVQAYFADHPQGCLLTRPEHFEKLAGSLSAEIVVLARQRRFLRRGEVLLVGRRGADVVAHEPAAGQRR